MSTVEKFFDDVEQWGMINAIYFGGVLLWAGLIFAADSLGYLPKIGDSSAWSWTFLGAGLFSLLGNLVRQVSPGILNPSSFDYLFGAVLLAIGIGGFTSLYIALSLLLVVAGGVILYSVFARSRRSSYKESAPHKRVASEQSDFDISSCMAMMEKMMTGHSQDCDCEEMMAQITSEGEIPDDWFKVMSDLMEVHCGPQSEEDKSRQES